MFGRLAGYEDVNDAERLSQDPVMRAIVDRKGPDRMAASTSQMGRFETEWLATDDNMAALTALSGWALPSRRIRNAPGSLSASKQPRKARSSLGSAPRWAGVA